MSNYQYPTPPPPPPPKRKIKISTIVPVVIIVVSVVGAMYFSGFFDDMAPGNVLTPTRDIEGTWKTSFSTKFYIATDSNTGQLQDVGYENRTMTLKITGTNDPNVVNVDVTFTFSDRHLVSDSGYVPDTSFLQLTGIINATQLTLTREDVGPIHQIGSVGVFTFTTHNMQGTWHDDWEGVYEQNVYTPTNGLVLIKQ